MRQTRSPGLFLSLFLGLLLLAAPLVGGTAFAEDEAPEDTPAARLFREAWWSETGAGALDKAVESYRKAVMAEGSKAVRARAQYRLAIVLQRMGRTEEGVRALESLAKDFSGQSELLTKARARLDEWTAEDLRESFGDWYRRYQYSPEFQSKIVDLILKLGAPDNNVANAAKEELLTIGAPALAALREHAQSANTKLRRTAVELIIRLGELPTPEALFGTNGWEGHSSMWKMLQATKGEQRVAYEAAAKEEEIDYRARWMLAVLAGPDAIVDVIAAEKSPNERATSNLAWTLRAMEPSPAIWKRLRDLVLDADVADHVRSGVASFIAKMHDWTGKVPDPTGFSDGDLLAWAASEAYAVRRVAWRQMASAQVRDPEAWKVPARFLDEEKPRGEEHNEAVSAMLGQLRVVPAEADVSEAVEALTRAMQRMRLQHNGFYAQHNGFYTLQDQSRNRTNGSPEVPRRVVAAAIATGKGQNLQGVVNSWWTAVGQDPQELPVVVAWISNAVDGSVRREALQRAAGQIRDGVGRMMAPFAHAKTRVELRDTLFQTLQNNQGLEALDWDPESLTLLVETADSEPRVNGRGGSSRSWTGISAGVQMRMHTRLGGYSSRVFFRLLQVASLRDMLFDTAAETPERFTEDIWLLLGDEWSSVEANRVRVLTRLERGWTKWRPDQQAAGLRVLLAPALVGRGDPAVDAFLRRCLAGGVDVAAREAALEALSKLSLEDVQATFDFADPKEAEAATRFLPDLPRTEAVYDAFKPLLTPDASKRVAERMFNAFRMEPKSRFIDLRTRLLALRGDPKLAKAVVGGLGAWAEVLPLWRIALKHFDAGVRTTAATILGTLYDDASIRALAAAVDDPSPTVRDAALKSLERIEKIEEQKDRWRKFADGRAPAPGKK